VAPVICGRESRPYRGYRRLAVGIALLAALGLADACWIEPRLLLFRDDVRIPLRAAPLTVAHLSDLHISQDRPLLRRLLAEVEAAHPDQILISGDLIRDLPQPERRAPHTAATAAFIAQLRRIAPVLAVQGHSEHQGDVIAGIGRAGLRWLSNEGTWIGGKDDRGILLLGVNQQVGWDEMGIYPSPFRPLRRQGRWHYGARFQTPSRNHYSHYDPSPAGLADAGGPLTWSGYEAVCDVWFGDEDAAAALVVHSRYVLGEDRLIRLRRVRPDHGQPGTFFFVPHGTALTGDIDTGVEPEPGRWYRVRVRTEVEPGLVRVMARVWPADGPEPAGWQARAEDRSPTRIEAGTVGLWASGEGVVLYRDLEVTDRHGQVLLDAPLTEPKEPQGFREGARGTRLALALARSPAVPPGTPTVVLSHVPEVAREASRRGLEVVLAGHTHGGQVRLPFAGALTTRTPLGALYDFGRFEFAAPNERGLTTLFLNGGVGTSLMPVRFWCPPRWAVVRLGRENSR
jgi:predicted MPP superfamily phosphohydrolase